MTMLNELNSADDARCNPANLSRLSIRFLNAVTVEISERGRSDQSHPEDGPPGARGRSNVGKSRMTVTSMPRNDCNATPIDRPAKKMTQLPRKMSQLTSTSKHACMPHTRLQKNRNITRNLSPQALVANEIRHPSLSRARR
jgi:hypothetical protein